MPVATPTASTENPMRSKEEKTKDGLKSLFTL
jgi:hypothetical protein